MHHTKMIERIVRSNADTATLAVVFGVTQRTVQRIRATPATDLPSNMTRARARELASAPGKAADVAKRFGTTQQAVRHARHLCASLDDRHRKFDAPERQQIGPRFYQPFRDGTYPR